MSNELELSKAFTELARAVTGDSVVTSGPGSSTVRGVVTAIAPLRARVGIADTSTSVTNSLPGYVPVIGDVVNVSRSGRRQYIIGKV